MISANTEAIQKSFTGQANNFETKAMSFTNQEYLEHIVSCINPKKTDTVLEAAAGTCICGRPLAPIVKNVTCLDMTPICNFCNELYARDTAKKIKSTFRMKGENGKHLTTNPPFGFVKDSEDKDKWLIDEEAAETVRYIFKLRYDGFGPTQIAKKLKAEKVLTPTAYKAQKDGKLLPAEPYK